MAASDSVASVPVTPTRPQLAIYAALAVAVLLIGARFLRTAAPAPRRRRRAAFATTTTSAGAPDGLGCRRRRRRATGRAARSSST